jgi:hypothetical protein
MRIISKWQDYYDCGLAYGRDTHTVYERHTTTHSQKIGESSREDKLLRTNRLSSAWWLAADRISERDTYLESAFLHIAGRRYPGLGIFSPSHKIIFEPMPNQFLWTEIDAESDSRLISSDGWSWRDDATKPTWDPVNEETVNQEFQSPVVLEVITWRYRYVTVNPSLKTLGFSKMVDPYQMFQEISMYIAGALNTWEDPNLDPEPTGAEKMLNKGMDPVKGFRHRT